MRSVPFDLLSRVGLEEAARKGDRRLGVADSVVAGQSRVEQERVSLRILAGLSTPRRDADRGAPNGVRLGLPNRTRRSSWRCTVRLWMSTLGYPPLPSPWNRCGGTAGRRSRPSRSNRRTHTRSIRSLWVTGEPSRAHDHSPPTTASINPRWPAAHRRQISTTSAGGRSAARVTWSTIAPAASVRWNCHGRRRCRTSSGALHRGEVIAFVRDAARLHHRVIWVSRPCSLGLCGAEHRRRVTLPTRRASACMPRPLSSVLSAIQSAGSGWPGGGIVSVGGAHDRIVCTAYDSRRRAGACGRRSPQRRRRLGPAMRPGGRQSVLPSPSRFAAACLRWARTVWSTRSHWSMDAFRVAWAGGRRVGLSRPTSETLGRSVG